MCWKEQGGKDDVCKAFPIERTHKPHKGEIRLIPTCFLCRVSLRTGGRVKKQLAFSNQSLHTVIFFCICADIYQALLHSPTYLIFTIIVRGHKVL